jgi:hypothetical protein
MTKAFILSFFKKLFLTVITFLLPIKGIILTVGLMIVADTVTGIFKAKRKGESITSRKLSSLVSKMCLYQSAVVLFYMIETYILSNIISLFVDVNLILTKLVAITLILIEIKSIDENVKAITGKSFIKKFKLMIMRAKELKNEIDDIKKES